MLKINQTNEKLQWNRQNYHDKNIDKITMKIKKITKYKKNDNRIKDDHYIKKIQVMTPNIWDQVTGKVNHVCSNVFVHDWDGNKLYYNKTYLWNTYRKTKRFEKAALLFVKYFDPF